MKRAIGIIVFFILFNSTAQGLELKDLGEMPEFQGIEQWMNSVPLTKESLKGKVVLVDFWTYTCINCLRTLPHLKEWHQKYKDKDFVIIGVHSPEFEFEKDPVNIKKAIDKFGISYPVALDSRMQTWTAYNNQFWPAHYFIDAKGHIRYTHFGEGDYENSEAVIKALLKERDVAKAETRSTKAKSKKGQKTETNPATQPSTQPTTQPATLPMTQLETLPESVPFEFTQIKSPETYLGFARRERLVTSGRPLNLNEWNYEGKWRTEGDRIVLAEGSGKIRFRFSATKVNLVLHLVSSNSVKAIVRLDGKVVNGNLEINDARLYELINLGSVGEEHTLEIEFLTPGIAAYAFTFG